MEALSSTVSTVAPPTLITAHLSKPVFSFSFTRKRSISPLLTLTQFPKSELITKCDVSSPSVSTGPLEETTESFDHGDKKFEGEKFDWFSHWYALMPVCDLDKKAPRGIKVLGLDVVVWWDKNENEWKVFEDRCPHRLAPLSEGRIDQWGRLQCVYHGWCFGGSGDCKLIPQAPLDGRPVHSSRKACVGVYPSTVQNGVVWFWPNTDPQYKDVITKKKPPYIPELDDPSFLVQWFTRVIPQGYEVLVENLMDPSHVPYSHTRIMSIAPEPSVKSDREGGTPIDISKQNLDINGFTATEHQVRIWTFVPPCLVQASPIITENPNNKQEEKLMEVGPSNWSKVCFVPTKADTLVTLFRTWLKKYAAGQFDWGTELNKSLPPIPPREQLMDRYWSHVVNCSTCTGAYKGLNALQLSLQVSSIALVAIIAATKQGAISVAARNALATTAILCFMGSKWLSWFIYKKFHYHDYNHAFK